MVDLPVITKILFPFRWFASPGILLIGLASLVARKTSLIYNYHPLGSSENLLSKRKGSLSPNGISDPYSRGAFGTPVANSCSQLSLPSQSSDPRELQLMTLQLKESNGVPFIYSLLQPQLEESLSSNGNTLLHNSVLNSLSVFFPYQCLCLSPTYELALQTGKVIEQMGKFYPELKLAYAVRGNKCEYEYVILVN